MFKKLKAQLMMAQAKLDSFAQDESGMEIVQVLVLLALAVVLIGVFIGFSDQITGVVGEKVSEFIEQFSGFDG